MFAYCLDPLQKEHFWEKDDNAVLLLYEEVLLEITEYRRAEGLL